MRYRYTAAKVSDVEEYISHIENKFLTPILQLHSVIPSVIHGGKVEQWLVIMEYGE